MKLYILIQRLLKRQWVRCFVLFFILISIIAVIASSFEEMSEYKVPLFGITYISSLFSGWIYSPHFICPRALSWYESSKSTSEIYIFLLWFCWFYSSDSLYSYLCILEYRSGAYYYFALYFIILNWYGIRALSGLSAKLLLPLRRSLRQPTLPALLRFVFCHSYVLYWKECSTRGFENIGDGIWWAIITFATVGYGDIYPITPLGKLLGCIICLVGVAMVAIPTGIISSSFINIVQKREETRRGLQ